MEEEKYPVNLSIPRPEKSSRGYAVAFLILLFPKMIILIPHLIIVWALGIAAFAVTIAAQFAVLFTGKYPAGMHKFVVGTERWRVRVSSFFLGLTDKYPPYRLRE